MTIDCSVPLLGFAARSGTGKTTLLTQVLPLLVEKGLRVGLVKYSHHDFDIDRPGKDSYRLREAGATPVLLTSPHRRAVITEFDHGYQPDLHTEVHALPLANLDLILVEGFKHVTFPKIEVHRQALGHDFLFPEDTSILAIAADCPVDTELPQLDLNRPTAVAEFILAYIGLTPASSLAS